MIINKLIVKSKNKVGKVLSAEIIAPIIRGILTNNIHSDYNQNIILNFSSSKNILEFVNGEKINEYSQKGTVTPDHVIRTKPVPLILNAMKAINIVNFKKMFKNELNKYIKNYINVTLINYI